MARPVTGKIMEDVVWARQKNGSFYCYKRKRIWKDGKVRLIEKKLLGKSDRKDGTITPTRGRRQTKGDGAVPDVDLSGNSTPNIKAARFHTGMMGIISYIGKDSGIDEDIYAVTDRPTAEKIISLARYIVATGGDTFPGIEEWMFTHPVPYGYPITEDVYRKLFDDIGTDESLRQGYFKLRFDREGDLVLLAAYDSSTEISVSRNPEARAGMNKDHNGKTTIKLLVPYSLRTRRPLAFAKQPANIPDVSSVENALSQLRALGVGNVITVTDGGFSSEDNLALILHSKNHSLTRVKIGWKWIKKEILSHESELRSVVHIMPSDLGVKGITIPATRTFRYTRIRGNKKKKISAGDTDTFKKRIYIHIFYDSARKEEEDKAFYSDLMDIRALLEKGEPLSDSAKKTAGKFLDIDEDGEKAVITLKEDAMEEACRYNGMFALVSDYYKTADEALQVYRKREWIEDFFERLKQDADGDTSRTGNPENLAGRMFVQFVAMSYVEITVIDSCVYHRFTVSPENIELTFSKYRRRKRYVFLHILFRELRSSAGYSTNDTHIHYSCAYFINLPGA